MQAYKAALGLAFLLLGITAGAWAGPFEDAVQSYDNKDYGEAHIVLGQVLKQSPDNAQAIYYDAISLKELGKLAEFRAAAEKLSGRHAELAPDQCESLDREYITAVYRARAFEKTRTLANQFPTSHPQSQALDRIRMIGLLSTFEQGMKKALEGKNWWVVDSPEARALSEKNWTNGTRDLRTFLDNKDQLERIFAADQSDISTKSQSNLFENVWRVRLILGEEKQLLQEMAQWPHEVQEYFQSVRALVAFQYFPENPDRDLGLLREFETTYPHSAWSLGIKREALRIWFSQGRFLYEHGKDLVAEGKTDAGESEKQRASKYLAQYRALLDDGLLADESGITLKDRDELVNNYLYSLLLERRLDELIAKSREFAATRPRGSKAWANSRLYEAQARYYRKPPEYAAATAILDDIIAENVMDDERNAHIPTLVLRWRMIVARRMDDRVALKRAFIKIRDAMPDNKYRDETLKANENLNR